MNDDQTTESFEEIVVSQSADNFTTLTLEKVELDIDELRLNKSPTPDSIKAEFFQRGCPVMNGATL